MMSDENEQAQDGVAGDAGDPAAAQAALPDHAPPAAEPAFPRIQVEGDSAGGWMVQIHDGTNHRTYSYDLTTAYGAAKAALEEHAAAFGAKVEGFAAWAKAKLAAYEDEAKAEAAKVEADAGAEAAKLEADVAAAKPADPPAAS